VVRGGACLRQCAFAPGLDCYGDFYRSTRLCPLGELLHQHGLEYRNTDGLVTASVADDGRATLAHRDPERTAAGFAHAEDRSAYLAMLQRLGENMAVTGVSFVLPAPEQSKKSRLVRLQLLCWLARYSG
jgi:phytoene dehydrogenase-like protein